MGSPVAELGLMWVADTPSLHPVSIPQAIMNKLWLGLDLQESIKAPILHVDSQGAVDYEPNFSQVRPEGGGRKQGSS